MLSKSMNPFLVAREVSFYRHNEPVFQPVSLSLSGGALTVLTGPNGSGKTTLIRLLAGILHPSEGSIERHGTLAFVGHRLGLKSDLDCVENLEFAQSFYSASLDRPALEPLEALDRVGLISVRRQLAAQLSAGQQRRLGLARLLVAPADLWLLDEPYTSLDADACEWLDALLVEHLDQAGSALVSTHVRAPNIPHPTHQSVVTCAKQAH